jgi:hypothetical protein
MSCALEEGERLGPVSALVAIGKIMFVICWVMLGHLPQIGAAFVLNWTQQ